VRGVRRIRHAGTADRARVLQLIQLQVEANNFQVLPVTLEHAAAVVDLPFHHRDPFDRLIAAQAVEEGLPVVSSDPVFKEYGVKRAW